MEVTFDAIAYEDGSVGYVIIEAEYPEGLLRYCEQEVEYYRAMEAPTGVEVYERWAAAVKEYMNPDESGAA